MIFTATYNIQTQTWHSVDNRRDSYSTHRSLL